MKLSRRDFVHAGCTVGIATLIPSIVDRAEAWTHGYVAPTTNANRVTVNARLTNAFINLSKSWNPSLPPPTLLNANGYPNGTITSNYSSGVALASGFYGQYFHGWSGSGAMQWVGQVAIVYSGGANVSSLTQGGGPAGSGYVTGNFNLTGSNAAAVFKFGTLVASVSGGNGSLVTITTVASLNFGSGLSTGTKISFNQGCSSNLISGPNSDGSWTITNVSGTQFTLNNSTGVVSPTVTGSGGVGTQTEAIVGASNPSLQYDSGTTFSSFGSLLICTQANYSAASSGSYWDPVYVAQLQQLKGTPSGVGRSGDFWLRFMDLSGVIGSYECDFSQRLTAASANWTSQSQTPIAYYGGAATNGGASGNFTDVYTVASNPSNSPTSGPPVDCEIIQATPGATNSGAYPALTMASGTRASFGTWPIFDGSNYTPLRFNITGGASGAGVNLVFTLTATWLNSGTPLVLTYTTVSGDTNTTTLSANLATFFNSNATIKAAKLVFSNSGNLAAIPPTALSGILTIVYTSGSATMSIGTLVASSIGSSGTKTFVFNALLGGFVFAGTGMVQSVPIEVLTQLCNLVGANMWFNWPVYTKAAYITACTNLIGGSSASGGLTSGLKFGAELGNEIWNIGTGLFGRCQCYGIALSTTNGGGSSYGNFAGNYSWQGLMTIQYAALSRAAWASAGRTASQHYVMMMGPEFDAVSNSNFDLTCCQGQYLVTSNSNYANYGTLGGTALSTSYNTAGNQPIDSADAIGCAPYWGSPWFNEAAVAPSGGGITGTVAQNAPMLQASIDYANGLSSMAFGELTNQFNGTTTRSSGSSGAITLNPGYATVFSNEEAQAAQYDSRRTTAGKKVLAILLYEGGPQWAMGANYPNGVNSASSLASAIASGDITALVTQMGNLSWTTTQLTPYTISGTGNLTEVATNILQMAQGWKYDTDINGNAVSTGSYSAFIQTYYYQALINAVAGAREVHPAEYGYAGSEWGFMWQNYNTGGALYQNFNAVQTWNT